jgi:hypothetical protein
MPRALLAPLGVLLVASSCCGAAVCHVAVDAPGAADENPGTEAQPFKTIQHATDVAQPGDTIYLHAGRYPESVQVRTTGLPGAPITVRAFGDDEVVLDGADPIPPDRWQRVEGFEHIYSIPLERDPGQVFVDKKPIYMKLEKVADFEWKLGTLTDADVGLWQFDPEGKRLLLNLGGGNPADGHTVEVPVRPYALVLAASWRIGGLHVRRYASTAIPMSGDDDVVEDCLVTDCGAGIVASGWDRRGAIIRRNTVIGTLGNGIFLQDRPTHCRVEDNLVIRCTLNPWRQPWWMGSVKMNSASDSLFAHNVVLEAGNPETINGWDGWALWGDINIVRVMYLGNTCAHNEDAGIYVEYGMGDTQAYFNTSYRDGHGITCRQSQRGMYMRNYIQSPRSSGLAVWGGAEPYPTVDHVFAHNLVRDAEPSLRLQIEHPNFSDYNTYCPREGALFADGEQGRKFATLEELQQATGHEANGEVGDVQPADVGLGLVTFRVPDAADPDERLMMIGNLGCEFEDPAGVNLLPYFWRAATGDGVERQFVYSAYTGLPGGVDTFAYGGAGGTLTLRGDPKIAHDGNRCLEVNGFEPSRIPPEGQGFRTPSLPARPGDTIDVSFWVSGKDLEPQGGTALSAFVEFTDATGQHRVRADVTGGVVVSGTFDWQQIVGTVTVPENARRLTLFCGLAPAKGTLWLDDFTLDAR